MSEDSEKINQLMFKLEILLKKQNEFYSEIQSIQLELQKLKTKVNTAQITDHKFLVNIPENETKIEISEMEPTLISTETITKQEKISRAESKNIKFKTKESKTDLEKFIGENLINKVGIAITILGVGIGAKYSIENELISPLTRIILGYVFGLCLLGLGIQLKKNYQNYSAVLVSGAMAIMYFITYAAHGFYHLIPQLVAFLTMLIFTIFTVIAALSYNRQVIAHIGLVGAYAVPFLLSDGSGNVLILFSYISILNIGILAISLKKYWKPLFFVSFGLTWIIIWFWYFDQFDVQLHFQLSLVFSTIFFFIFYATFLSYKIIQKEQFNSNDVVLVLVNSFLFYGFNYFVLDAHSMGKEFLGLFTLINALIHFVMSVLIFRQNKIDRNIQNLIIGLVFVFITLSIPVQLNGNWVTIMWATEAALLFWIARAKGTVFYEKISYPLMVLATLSLLDDWTYVYDSHHFNDSSNPFIPILNVNFLTSFLFLASFGWIYFWNKKIDVSNEIENRVLFSKIRNIFVPTVLIAGSYFAFRWEIACFWDIQYTKSTIELMNNEGLMSKILNHDLIHFKVIWIINYTLFFLTTLIILNNKKLKNNQLGFVNLVGAIIFVFVFLTQGLYILSEIRESYLEIPTEASFKVSVFHLIIRYISFSLLAFLFYACYDLIHKYFPRKNYKTGFELFLHLTLVWSLSSELIHWMDLSEASQSYKLGLSIFWGVYSLILIALGIWKNNKPNRIAAICLFGVTLLKLFLYDISHLNTIAKTIVFVSLGVLLLGISFLYNKYKNLISKDEIDR